MYSPCLPGFTSILIVRIQRVCPISSFMAAVSAGGCTLRSHRRRRISLLKELVLPVVSWRNFIAIGPMPSFIARINASAPVSMAARFSRLDENMYVPLSPYSVFSAIHRSPFSLRFRSTIFLPASSNWPTRSDFTWARVISRYIGMDWLQSEPAANRQRIPTRVNDILTLLQWQIEWDRVYRRD